MPTRVPLILCLVLFWVILLVKPIMAQDFTLITGIGNSDPLSPLIQEIATNVESSEGFTVTTVSYPREDGILAAAKLALSEPDGLTLGFLSLNTILTRSALHEAPYRADNFKPIALGFERPHALITHKNSNFASLSGLKFSKGKIINLIARRDDPWSVSNLLAIDILEGLQIPYELKLVEGAAKRPLVEQEPAYKENIKWNPELEDFTDYAYLFETVVEGELLALPMDTLLEFAEHKIPFVVVAVLTDYPKESPLYPDSAFLQSSGLKLTIHDYYGFFYVSNTSQELMEDVPFLIKAILESSKSKDIPILPLYFDSLKRIYDSELSRRLELISIGEKGPAAR